MKKSRKEIAEAEKEFKKFGAGFVLLTEEQLYWFTGLLWRPGFDCDHGITTIDHNVLKREYFYNVQGLWNHIIKLARPDISDSELSSLHGEMLNAHLKMNYPKWLNSKRTFKI